MSFISLAEEIAQYVRDAVKSGDFPTFLMNEWGYDEAEPVVTFDYRNVNRYLDDSEDSEESEETEDSEESEETEDSAAVSDSGKVYLDIFPYQMRNPRLTKDTRGKIVTVEITITKLIIGGDQEIKRLMEYGENVMDYFEGWENDEYTFTDPLMQTLSHQYDNQQLFQLSIQLTFQN